MIEDENERIKWCMDDVQEFISKALYQYEPDMIAASLVIKGFGIYRSLFTDDEYDKLCFKIYQDRHKVK